MNEFSFVFILTNENKLKKFNISITYTGDYHYVCVEKRKIKYDGMHSLNNPVKDLAAPELMETNERGVWGEKRTIADFEYGK